MRGGGRGHSRGLSIGNPTYTNKGLVHVLGNMKQTKILYSIPKPDTLFQYVWP